MKYVLGFLFSPDYKQVVLINKTKPVWQAGRWNGVGGKIESGETPSAAMSREFEEETGLLLYDWSEFGSIVGPTWRVNLFATQSEFIGEVSTLTEEEVAVFVSDWVGLSDPNVAISNVGYLVPLAKDFLRNPRSPKSIKLNY